MTTDLCPPVVLHHDTPIWATVIADRLPTVFRYVPSPDYELENDAP